MVNAYPSHGKSHTRQTKWSDSRLRLLPSQAFASAQSALEASLLTEILASINRAAENLT